MGSRSFSPQEADGAIITLLAAALLISAAGKCGDITCIIYTACYTQHWATSIVL